MTDDLKRKLNSLANDALNVSEQTEAIESFQSVITMIDTLIQDGRVKELQSAIHIYFPEYFTTLPPLIFSKN